MTSRNNLRMTEVTFPTGKPHVSFSEIRSWSECSFRHKLQQIDKIDAWRPSIHASFGKTIHSVCESYLKSRIIDKDFYVTEFDKMWAGINEETENAIKTLQEKQDRNQIEDKALQSLQKALRDISPGQKGEWLGQGMGIIEEVPGFLEETFPEWEYLAAEAQLYEMMEKHGISFKGFIDAVIRVKGPKGKDLVWILDHKTCGWGWDMQKKTDPMVRSQLVYYKHFWSQKLGVDFKDVRCGFVLLKRTAKPGNRCELIPVSVGDVTLGRSLKILDNMVSSVKNGIAIKNRESCKWCDFKGTKWCP